MSESNSVVPFIIVGCPRTGTTLLRRILNTHSLIAIPPESLFVAEYLAAENLSLKKRKTMFCRDPAFRSWGVAPKPGDLADCRTMADCVRVAHEVYAAAQGKPCWGHKTQPFVRRGRLIAKHFRELRFVHTVRDSRAVARSLKRSGAHRLNVLIGATRYNLATSSGLDLEEELPERTYRVRYEDLVASPDETVRALCRWLQIPFQPAMIEEVGKVPLPMDAAEMKSTHHDNVNRPITSEFADRWQTDLTAEEINLVTWLTAETMRRAGYQVARQCDPPSTWYLNRLRLQHYSVAGFMILRNLWARPYLLSILSRKWRLGTLPVTIREVLLGR